MTKLSHLAENLKGSEIVKLGNEISARVHAGEKIYNYTIGDFDPKIFPIPGLMEQMIIDSYKEKNTNYPAAQGIIELRKSVSHFAKKWNNLDYDPSEILIASGGRPLIYGVFAILVDEGDKVIYAVPSWNNNHYTYINKGIHCVIETTVENNFMPTAAEVEPHLKDATLLCLCTPQNPTGTTLEKEELEKICQLVVAENKKRGADEKKLYVMFDQMYFTLTYGKTKHYNPVSLMPEMKEFTIFISGISKAFAATGVRVGWSLGPEKVIAKMRSLLTHMGTWAPMAEQKALSKFLLEDAYISDYFSHFKAALSERLEKIYDAFIKLRDKGFPVDAIIPQAAIYLTLKFDLKGKKINDRVLETQRDITSYILDEAKLAVVPFYAFGAEEHSPWYRLSVGTCKLEDLDGLFAQLEEALKKLK
ncbi:MAG: aminotransferase class I/II-fold pyridoxal phosphate-dependent enzyme [Bacteroidetes bacterium]|nr:aminotransferase class I/II-fold pyridoxal phosphate-dependent enzyme [Bacteroidota bacterium]